MASSRFATYSDLESYQAAVSAQTKIFVTSRGNFVADLTLIELPRLRLLRSREVLSRIIQSTVSTARPPIFFLADAEQRSLRHSGMEVSFGEIVAISPGSSHHHCTNAPCHWAAVSLTREDLASMGHSIVGRDLTAPPITRKLRPSPRMMSQLLTLHKQAGQLARNAPNRLNDPEVARSLEHALIHALIQCLTERTPIEMSAGGRHHLAVMRRFEEFLATHYDKPAYLAEICVATGASERTLRVCCEDHLGMGPIRYLWLRRMYLAHHDLVIANSAGPTVTEIATRYGFWELGRFSVEYRKLFGEPPSVSLHRQPREPRTPQSNPFALPASEFA